MFDVVLPKKNEKDFVTMAKKLDYSTLIFLYKNLDNVTPFTCKYIKIQSALLIDSDKKSEIIKLVNKAKSQNWLAFVYAKTPLLNRFIIEKSKADALVNVEYNPRKDHLHFRKSGLDQVICKMAAKKDKMFLTSLAQLKSTNLSKVLGRIKQNVTFCNKYKVAYHIVTFAEKPFDMKSSHDMKSLMVSLS